MEEATTPQPVVPLAYQPAITARQFTPLAGWIGVAIVALQGLDAVCMLTIVMAVPSFARRDWFSGGAVYATAAATAVSLALLYQSIKLIRKQEFTRSTVAGLTASCLVLWLMVAMLPIFGASHWSRLDTTQLICELASIAAHLARSIALPVVMLAVLAITRTEDQP